MDELRQWPYFVPQTFCRFPFRGKGGKSPFVEVHVGLESLFSARPREATVDTLQSKKKQMLEKTSIEQIRDKLEIKSHSNIKFSMTDS